jgi:hypothetical protein
VAGFVALAGHELPCSGSPNKNTRCVTEAGLNEICMFGAAAMSRVMLQVTGWMVEGAQKYPGGQGRAAAGVGQ